MPFTAFREKIEAHLHLSIEKMGEKNALRDACAYALLNGGKRLRPILVLLIAESIGKGFDVMPSALAVEFFHTASLIADDLPCMDDDNERRSHPSLHKAFDESTAILASYALIAEGYGGIYKNGLKNPKFSAICLDAATRCAGINGATNGQFLDLSPPNTDLDTIKKIIYQKTVTLFEISFIFGWVFGGGNLDLLDLVKKAALHLGMAFQIADDLLDLAQDETHPNAINIAKALGKKRALELFEEEIDLLKSSLKELRLWNSSFKKIVDWLVDYPLRQELALLEE